MTEAVKKVFQNLKDKFTTASLLAHFDQERRIRLEPDASGAVVAAILTQLQDDGHCMGVDISDVRAVLHLDLPRNVLGPN